MIPMRGAAPRRHMSGNDDPKEIDKGTALDIVTLYLHWKGIALWKQASWAGLAFCLLWTGWELSHHHEEHAPSKTAPSIHIRYALTCKLINNFSCAIAASLCLGEMARPTLLISWGASLASLTRLAATTK